MNSGKVLRALLPVVLSVWIMALPCHAQWSRLMTLEGFRASNFAVTDAGILYTYGMNDDGIQYSTDTGESWVHRSDLDSLSISGIQAHGNSLYILASGGVIHPYNQRLRKLDAPQGSPEVIPSPYDGSVGTFFITKNGTIYITLVGNPATDSVYVSTDAGSSWRSICAKYSDVAGKNALIVDPLERIWSYDLWGIARFDVESGQWIRWGEYGSSKTFSRWYFFDADASAYINTGYRVAHLSKYGETASTVYETSFIAYPVMEFWRTGNGTLLISERSNDDVPYRFTYRITTDDGATWEYIDTSRTKAVYFLGEHGGWLYATSGTELLRSNDLGRTFEGCQKGIAAADVNSYEIRGERINAVTSRYSFSGDGGATWNYREFDGDSPPWDVQVISDGTIFEAWNVFRVSHDSARTWVTPLPPDYDNSVQQFFAMDDLIVGLFGDNSIRRSSDGGMNWTPVYQVDGTHRPVNFIRVHDAFYALHDDALLRSTDRGVTWSTAMLPAMETPLLFGNARVLLLSASSILWSSTDHGDSWIPLPLDTLTRTLMSVAVSEEGMFAAIRRAGQWPFGGTDVVYSADDGITWGKITGNLPKQFTGSGMASRSQLAFTASNRLFVNVRSRGFYVYDAAPLAVESPAPRAAPMALDLWPTAADRQVIVRSNNTETVDLTITSVTGEQMYASPLSAGESTRAVDVASWPAGTYFLHAVSATASTVRPFVVVR